MNSEAGLIHLIHLMFSLTQMKHLSIFILLSALICPLHAQLNGVGFYRVKNQRTQRYISVIDNKGSIDPHSANADLGAIITVKGFERVVSDPGSLIYIKKMGSEYDLIAQGTSVYGIVGITVQLIPFQDGAYYRAYKASSGVARYLFDLSSTTREEAFVTTTGNLNSGAANWEILPLTTDDNYFAIQPDVQTTGGNYTTLYTSFAYHLNHAGDKAMYITKVDGNVAVYKEICGDIPASIPVILSLTSATLSEHQITPLLNTPTVVTDNALSGTYYCSSVTGHINRLANDATIRVLGVLSDGSLGFKKSATMDYVPHNTAYLKVDANAPAEIRLMSEEEYDKLNHVTLTAVNVTREYGEANPELTYNVDGNLIGGTPVLTCEATEASPVGTYPITIAKGDVANSNVELVNGTLTITPAPLLISVGFYQREEGQENPEMTAEYTGFKNGDTPQDLTTLPTITVDADTASVPGYYDIVVFGAESPNYEITYQYGTLQVLEHNGVRDILVARRQTAYTLQGTRVPQRDGQPITLTKGVYVIGGRKVIVK